MGHPRDRSASFRPRLPPLSPARGAKACRGGTNPALRPALAPDEKMKILGNALRAARGGASSLRPNARIRSVSARRAPRVRPREVRGGSGAESSHRARRRDRTTLTLWRVAHIRRYPTIVYANARTKNPLGFPPLLGRFERPGFPLEQAKTNCGKFSFFTRHCTKPVRAIIARPARFAGAISCRWRFETRSDARPRPRRGRPRRLGR